MPPPRTDSVERDTVLILGAGASLGARPEAECRPPLGAALAGYLLHWLEVNKPRRRVGAWSPGVDDDEENDKPDKRLWYDFEELRPVLEKARDCGAPDGFERAMSELADASKTGLLHSLNRVIAVSFLGGKACAFCEGEDLYDQLFRALGNRLRAIVTPNYDTLAEEALGRTGASYWYAGTTWSQEPIALYKIHGSTNFVQPSGSGRGATIEIAQSTSKPLRAVPQTPFPSFFNDHPLYAIRGHRNTFLHHDGVNDYRPIMVTYGPAKPAVYGLPYLEQIRQACSSGLRAAPPARVIAIGIRPPVDDSGADDPTWSGLCRLMADLSSNKSYWSGNAQERSAMARFGFVGRDGWFEDFVKSIESGKES
jgi:hypothetical protein